jgi:hypothetical protein
MLVLIETVGAARWNSVQATHRRHNGYTMLTVFEVKKEIPDDIRCKLAEPF